MDTWDGVFLFSLLFLPELFNGGFNGGRLKGDGEGIEDRNGDEDGWKNGKRRNQIC